MSQYSATIAVDIGNSRVKFGWFAPGALRAGELPTPDRTLDLMTDRFRDDELRTWLAVIGEPARWIIGSVHRPMTRRLSEWLATQNPRPQVTLLTAADLPLVVRLAEPEKVGIDRLLGAVAANRLRRPDRAAVVVDLGSALTVDLVAADGAFLGGAILPGIAMAARALDEQTDLLPRIDMTELADGPAVLGTSTVSAMQSGLFWGAVGAIRELVMRLGALSDEQADVFLTGGAAPSVAPLFGPQTRYVSHLVLGGMVAASTWR